MTTLTTIKQHPLSLTISIAAITIYALESCSVISLVTYHEQASIVDFLTFHFFHANVFHLLANLMALWYFRPRLSTILLSFPIATLSAYLDSMVWNSPTCGLSAFLMACFARYYVSWRKNIYTLIAINLLAGLIPTVNWHVHLLSFFISYIVWTPIYILRR